MDKFRKKPAVIEAVQFDGNFDEIEVFVGGDAEFRDGEAPITEWPDTPIERTADPAEAFGSTESWPGYIEPAPVYDRAGASCRTVYETRRKCQVSIPPNGDWADEAVDEIIDDLNSRSGLGLDDIEDGIQDEIRATWATAIRGCAAKYVVSDLEPDGSQR